MSKTSFGYRVPLALVLVACAACSPTVDLGGPLAEPAATPGSEGENPGQEPTAEAYPVAIGEAAPLGALNRARIDSIAAHDDVVFVASSAGTFRSVDAGATWQEIVFADLAAKTDRVISVAFFEGQLFALTRLGAVFASSDDGATFPVTSRARPSDGTFFPDGYALRASHGVLLGIFEGRLHRFTGGAWTELPSGEGDFFDEVTTDGNLIFAHSSPFGVVKRMPLAAEVATWTEIEELSGWAYRLSWAGDAGFAWSQQGGLRRSTDGITWTTIADSETLGEVGHVAQSKDQKQFVLTSSLGIYLSTDGVAWRKDTSVSASDVAVGSYVFAAGAGVYRSEGASFVPTSLNTGDVLQIRGGPRPEARTAWGSLSWDSKSQRWLDVATPGPSVETADGTRYAIQGDGFLLDYTPVLREDQDGWKKIASAPGRLLGAVGKRLYATGISWQGASCGGKVGSPKANDVFAYSDDQGATWSEVEGLARVRLSCEPYPGYESFVSVSGNDSITLLLATAPWNTVYIARDGKAEYARTMDGLDPKLSPTASLVSGDTALLAYDTKLFQLEGSSWKPLAGSGLPEAARIVALAQVEGCVAAAVEATSSGVYTSCDKGATFTLSAKVEAPAVLDYRKGSGELLVGSRKLGVWRAPVTRR